MRWQYSTPALLAAVASMRVTLQLRRMCSELSMRMRDHMTLNSLRNGVPPPII